MKINTQKINTKYFLFILTIYILTFQDIIQTYIPVFRYFDEVLSLLVFPTAILRSFKSTKIQKDNLLLIVLLIVIIIIGLYSNMKFKYQPLKIALSDMLLILKFFMAYFLSNMLLSEEFVNSNKSKICKHIKLIIYFLFICTILNYIFKIWPGADVRYGILTNKLFYGHPTALAAASIFLLALLELTTENKKEKILPILCIYIVLMSTLRLKAIGAASLIIIMLIYVHKTKKRVTLSKLAILGIIAIVVAYDQIYYYFFEIEQSARNQLLLKSIEIMKDFFPIGTGFATFGSYFSTISYSPVYYEYNLSNIYGLQPDSPDFASDSFWPMIFGQFGVLGTVCYIYCVITIFKDIQKNFSKSNINIYLGKLICLVYLMISSTAESAFVHPMAIPLALIIGIRASNKKYSVNQPMKKIEKE